MQDHLPATGLARRTAAAGGGAHAMQARVLRIDAVLPQTQCGQCGYAGCLPYAQAMAAGRAPINRCPPGGAAGVAQLAQLLGCAPLALDPACGPQRALHVARIDESLCIGCTLCIQACPVDAIVGAVKQMHVVLAADCTGCDLCLAPCPMDCIAMIPVEPPRQWTRADADRARHRLQARSVRLQTERVLDEARLVTKALHKLGEIGARTELGAAEIARRQAIVERALERVRARRGQPPPDPQERP